MTKNSLTFSPPLRVILTAALMVLLLALIPAAGSYALDPNTGAPAKFSDSNARPPFAAAVDRAGGAAYVAEDIRPTRAGGSWYLFLPGSADPASLLFTYTGDKLWYQPDTREYLKAGESAPLDMSGPSNKNTKSLPHRFFEYDPDECEFYRYTLYVVTGNHCPSIHITLDRGDEGLVHINSAQSNFDTGFVSMVRADGSIVYDGRMRRLKGHGLTSYEASGRAETKNSYNLNLEKPAELVESAGKSRKWTLLKIRPFGNYDPTGMSYITAFYTWNALVLDAYPNMTAEYVDLYINGEYRGAYILSERMDVNAAIPVTDVEGKMTVNDHGRQSVRDRSDPAIAEGIRSYSYCPGAILPAGSDITGGYVLEVMCGTHGTSGFITKKGMYVNIKSPEFCTQAQVRYIASYVQAFENAIFSDSGFNSHGIHYSEYIDERSFAAQTLVYAFYLNWEIYRTSTYMYKDFDGSPNGVLHFGPVWDFETGPGPLFSDKTLLGTIFSYDVEQQYIWFEQMWRRGDYMKLLTDMNFRMESVIGQMLGFEAGEEIFTYDEMAEHIRQTQEMNWLRWSQDQSYDTCAVRMKEALITRFNHWFGSLWDGEKYLLGCTADAVRGDGGGVTLYCNIFGSYESCRWYRLNEDGFGLTPVEGSAPELVLPPGEGGIYLCAVTGQNNAYYSRAVGSVFRRTAITMYSNPIDAESADTLSAINTVMPTGKGSWRPSQLNPVRDTSRPHAPPYRIKAEEGAGSPLSDGLTDGDIDGADPNDRAGKILAGLLTALFALGIGGYAAAGTIKARNSRRTE